MTILIPLALLLATGAYTLRLMALQNDTPKRWGRWPTVRERPTLGVLVLASVGVTAWWILAQTS